MPPAPRGHALKVPVVRLAAQAVPVAADGPVARAVQAVRAAPAAVAVRAIPRVAAVVADARQRQAERQILPGTGRWHAQRDGGVPQGNTRWKAPSTRSPVRKGQVRTVNHSSSGARSLRKRLAGSSVSSNPIAIPQNSIRSGGVPRNPVTVSG
jgi:hypothetical protein